MVAENPVFAFPGVPGEIWGFWGLENLGIWELRSGESGDLGAEISGIWELRTKDLREIWGFGQL